jgi:aldehyde dehydrogenase (NAD+)
MATQAEAPAIPFLEGGPKQLLIGGDRVDSISGDTFESVNPANGEVIANVARAGAADVDLAVKAARAALEGPWGSTGPADRQKILLRLAELIEHHAEELALIDVVNVGRLAGAARYLAYDAASLLRWYASAARGIRGETFETARPQDVFGYTLREPVGVVGAITPWNAPLTIAIWKLGPVLATGCTAVHKPAEQSPLSALRFAELCLEAGVPEGVINVVTGDGEAGAALAEHLDVDKVTFTGSIETGQKIIRASAGNIKRLTLELGGKSPNIVFADADLDAAVTGAARSIFIGSGQVCVAGSRLFVERAVYEEVVARVAEYGKGLVVGDPLAPGTDLGPVVSQGQLDRILSYVEIGREEGSELLSGGSRVTDGALAQGYYVSPTVFAGVDDSKRIAREEIFGPVVAATPFDDVSELTPRVNGTPYGLAAYVWTRDVGRAHRLARAVKAGNIGINTTMVLDQAMPMGGYKMSGYGHELGAKQLDDYLQTKSVHIKTS